MIREIHSKNRILVIASTKILRHWRGRTFNRKGRHFGADCCTLSVTAMLTR